jgi:hypothetical protein
MAQGQALGVVSTAQVFRPSIEYSGQLPSEPVASGTRPIHPQGPMVPAMAKPIKMSPTRIRALRSSVPTFLDIRCSLQKVETACPLKPDRASWSVTVVTECFT